MYSKIFLDMDGVVADWVGAACELHEIDNRFYTTEYEYDPQTAYHALEIWAGLTPSEFFKPMGYDFWYNLNKTPEADQIVNTAIDHVGVRRVAFLTSPCLTPGCTDAKRDWVKKHYPDISVLFSCSTKGNPPPKWMAAGPGKILIDDSDINCNLWARHGGSSFLFPRPWNSKHRLFDRFSISHLEKYLGVA